MRDNQRQRVYDMEWKVAPSQEIITDKREARRFFKHICQSMDCEELKVYWRKGGRGSYYTQKDGVPTICINMITKETIIHEIAHYITEKRYGRSVVAAHGPEFAGILLAMFIVFLGTEPKVAFHASQGLVV